MANHRDTAPVFPGFYHRRRVPYTQKPWSRATLPLNSFRVHSTKIIVNGYTDNVPIGPGLMRQGITSNEVLSQKRADNVMQFMISRGVKPSLLSARGFGEADPVASNDTPEGRAQNRRVELTLAGSGQ